MAVWAPLAAWLWYIASRRRLRRISRFEALDSADLNRIVTTINRNSLLNSRAALATAISAGWSVDTDDRAHHLRHAASAWRQGPCQL